MAKQVTKNKVETLKKEIKKAIQLEKRENININEEYRIPIHDLPKTMKEWKKIGGESLDSVITTLKTLNRNPNSLMVTLSSGKEEKRIIPGQYEELKDRFGGYAGSVPKYEIVRTGGWQESKVGLEYIDRELSARNKFDLVSSKAFQDAKHTFAKKDPVTHKIVTKTQPLLSIIPLDQQSLITSSLTGNISIYELPDGTLLGARGLSKQEIQEARTRGLVIKIENKSEYDKVYKSIDKKDIETSNLRREQLFINYKNALDNVFSGSKLGNDIIKEIDKLFKDLHISAREFMFLFYTSDVFGFDYIYNEGEYIQYNLRNKISGIKSEIEALRKTEVVDGRKIHTYPGYQTYIDTLDKEDIGL